MTTELTLYGWAGAALGAALIGIAKTGIPGIGIVAVAVMAVVFGAKPSVGTILPLLITGDLVAVAYYRHHAEWNRLVRLLPWVLVGIPIGAVVLAVTPALYFRPFLGALVLALLAFARWQKRWEQVPNTWWFAAGTGVLAGVATTVGNAAGPIMAAYFISQGFDKRRFMGTAAWFFFLINLIKIPVFGALDLLSLQTLPQLLPLAAIVATGALTGRRIMERIPQNVFDALVLILAATAGIRLLIG